MQGQGAVSSDQDAILVSRGGGSVVRPGRYPGIQGEWGEVSSDPDAILVSRGKEVVSSDPDTFKWERRR